MTATHSETLSAEQRHQMIAEAAYYIAEQDGFQDGDAWAHWLQAETEIDRMLEAAPVQKASAKRTPRTAAAKLDKEASKT